MVDNCEPIRKNLIQNKINLNRYDICYTHSRSLSTGDSYSLCRYDSEGKVFVCRPNDIEEKLYTPLDFCNPMMNMSQKEIKDKYYPSVFNKCSELNSSLNQGYSKNKKYHSNKSDKSVNSNKQRKSHKSHKSHKYYNN